LVVVDVFGVEGTMNIHKTVGFLYKTAPMIKGYTNIFKIEYTNNDVLLYALTPDTNHKVKAQISRNIPKEDLKVDSVSLFKEVKQVCVPVSITKKFAARIH